jgi:hypothetical protein
MLQMVADGGHQVILALGTAGPSHLIDGHVTLVFQLYEAIAPIAGLAARDRMRALHAQNTQLVL